MNPQLLTFLALTFGALVILQAALGGWLFVHNIGVMPDQIHAYYADKSFQGILEVLLPHTFWIMTALVGMLHFLAFIDTIDEQNKTRWLHTLFILFVLDQSSGVFIMLGWELFAYVKLIAFASFELSLACLWVFLYQANLRTLSSQNADL